MEYINTDAPPLEFLLNYIRGEGIINIPECIPNPFTPQKLITSLDQQDAILWHHFMEGKIDA